MIRSILLTLSCFFALGGLSAQNCNYISAQEIAEIFELEVNPELTGRCEFSWQNEYDCKVSVNVTENVSQNEEKAFFESYEEATEIVDTDPGWDMGMWAEAGNLLLVSHGGSLYKILVDIGENKEDNRSKAISIFSTMAFR